MSSILFRGIKKIDLFFWLALIVMIGLYLVSLWSSEIPPSIDTPAHLALVANMQHLGEAGHVFNRTYEWGYFPAPNSFFYLLAYFFGLFFSLLTVHYIMISLYMVGLPLAFYYYLHAHGRNSRFSLAVFPLLITFPVIYGFLDYCFGVALSIFMLAYIKRYFREPSTRTGIMVAVLSFLLYLTHIHAFLFYAVGVSIKLILRFIDERKTGAGTGLYKPLARDGSVALLSGIVPFVIWRISAAGEIETGTQNMIWEDLLTKMGKFGEQTLLVLDGVADETYALFFSIGAISSVFLIARHAIKNAGNQKYGETVSVGSLVKQGLRDFPLMMGIGMVLLFFGLPYQWAKGYIFMSSRTAAPMLIFLLAAIIPKKSIAIGRSWLYAVILPFALSVLVSWGSYHRAIEEFDTLSPHFFEVLEQANDQSALLFYPEEKPIRGFEQWIYYHAGQYHTVVNQGVTSVTFAVHSKRIIKKRRPGWDVQFLPKPLLFSRPLLKKYDYVLQFGEEHLELTQNSDVGFKLVDRRGKWALYEIELLEVKE